MLRIRFGEKEVTVALSGESCSVDVTVTRSYGEGLEVEYFHARRFWQAVAHPLGIMRLGQKAKEMGDEFVAVVRGDKDKEAQS